MLWVAMILALIVMVDATWSIPPPYVSMCEAGCPGAKCALTPPDGVPLHFDRGRFTESGARWVTRGITDL